MRLTSRGLATDLMLARLDGEVLHGDHHIAVRTPSCPGFWWGNFVIFDTPARRGQLHEWEALFDRELATVPGIEHRLFTWDSVTADPGESHAFVDAGYTLDEALYLINTRPSTSPRHRADLPVRPLASDAEWRRALELLYECFDDPCHSDSFRRFQATQMQRNRRLVEHGAGQWFGAFRGDELVATMGLFVQEGLGRCQSVATSPRHRRAGYCSTLLSEVCRYGIERLGARELVIRTHQHNPAARVYRSVGFTLEERVASLSLADRERAERGASGE